MRYLSKRTILAIAIPALSGSFSAAVYAEEEVCPYYESRSGLCGYYDSEISPARAFADTVAVRGKWGKPSQQPAILDVRSTPEYRAGHPEHAYNAPYPFIYQYCDDQGRTPDGACIKGADFGPDVSNRIAQDEEDFVRYVESIIPDKGTPIYTLCRTGVRSVGAANVLTKAGYTHVRNIWEGFVGVYLKARQVQQDGSIKEYDADLNHDTKLTDEDKNGWRYHQGLPYDTRLLPPLIYQPYAYTYDWD